MVFALVVKIYNEKKALILCEKVENECRLSKSSTRRSSTQKRLVGRDYKNSFKFLR